MAEIRPRRDPTVAEWVVIRARWQGAHDESVDNFRWLAEEVRAALGVTIGHIMLSKRAHAEGWLRKGDPVGPLTERFRGGRPPPIEPGVVPPDPAVVYPVAILPGRAYAEGSGQTAGRPRDYRPEYAEMLHSYIRSAETEQRPGFSDQGLPTVETVATKLPTLAAFAMGLNVTTETLARWAKGNPDFHDACVSCRDMQGDRLMNGALLGMYESRTASLALKNLAGWKDKVEVEAQVSEVSIEALEARFKERMARARHNATIARDERRRELAILRGDVGDAVPAPAQPGAGAAGETPPG